MADISKLILPDNSQYNLKDNYAVHQAPDHQIIGADGWYKFMDIPAQNNMTRNIVLLIQENYSTASGATGGKAFGIWKIILNVSSIGSRSCTITQLVSNIYTNENIGSFIDTENNKFQFFFKKIGSSTTDQLCFQIISSISRTGSYIDLSSYWTSVAVADADLPATIVYSAAMQDGAGNIIKDTYATKIAVDAKVNDSVIASVEPTSTASEYHNAGEVFMLNGNLYWATDNIGVGETIVPGTNADLMTVAQYTGFVGEALWESVGQSYVPNTLTVNGKALSTNITLNANDVGAVNKASDYSFHGPGGWYRFLTTGGILENTSQSFLLLIQDTYSRDGTANASKALISIYLNRTSSSAGGVFSLAADILYATGFTNESFYWTYDTSTNSASVYVRKTTNSTGYIAITIISSFDRTCNYINMANLFEATAISTLPTGGEYFKALQDGAGNVIPDTYATKAELAALDAADIAYSNTSSGLTADDVQEAIDELDDFKISRKADFIIQSTDTGWYKFLEIDTTSTATFKNLTLLITEGYSGLYVMLVSIHLSRTANSSGVSASILGIAGYKQDCFAYYESSPGIFSFYIKKQEGSSDINEGIAFQVLTNNGYTGAVRSDLDNCWLSTKINSLPSDVRYPNINYVNKQGENTISGTTAGWHNFLSIPMSNSTGFSFTLLITNGRRVGASAGILSARFYRAAAGTVSYAYLDWLALDSNFNPDWVCWKLDSTNNILNFYFYIDTVAENKYYNIQSLISRDQLNQNLRLTPYWKDEVIADLTDYTLANAFTNLKMAATQVSYSNTSSGLTATNAQAALDEINSHKVSKIPDHQITGNSGWHRFLDITIDSARGRSFSFLIVNEYYANTIGGILSGRFYRNSSGTLTYYNATFLSLDSNSQSYRLKQGDIRWKLHGSTVSFYLYKYGSTNEILNIYVNSSSYSTGSTSGYLDFSSYFVDEIVEEPTAATDVYFILNEYVPTARTINGNALSADVTLDSEDIGYDNTDSGLTADDVQEAIDEISGIKLSRLADFKTTGTSGWRKIFSIDMASSGVSLGRIFTLRVYETFSSNACAIVKYYFYKSSSNSFTSYARLLTSAVYQYNDFAYDISGTTVNLYVNKKGSSSSRLSVQVLFSVDIAGDYIDLSPYWTATAVTLPEGSSYALKMTDGSGHDIEDYYATKTEMAALNQSSSITLQASWTDNQDGTFTQTGLSITNATINSSVTLKPTVAQMKQLIADGTTAIIITNNQNDPLTFTATAFGDAPTVLMTIACTLTEES